jgi:hypothetical protein
MLKRQKEASRSRGYDGEITVSPTVILLEGELMATGLDLDQALEVKTRLPLLFLLITKMARRSVRQLCISSILVTLYARDSGDVVCLSSLRMDFNLRVSSFETSIGRV